MWHDTQRRSLTIKAMLYNHTSLEVRCVNIYAASQAVKELLIAISNPQMQFAVRQGEEEKSRDKSDWIHVKLDNSGLYKANKIETSKMVNMVQHTLALVHKPCDSIQSFRIRCSRPPLEFHSCYNGFCLAWPCWSYQNRSCRRSSGKRISAHRPSKEKDNETVATYSRG